MCEDDCEICFTKNVYVVELVMWQAVCTHFQLVCAFLTADIKYLQCWQTQNGLESERTFSYARLTSEKHYGTGHESTTEDTVELLVVKVDTRLVLGTYLTQK